MELSNINLKALTVLIRATDALHEVIKKDVAQYGLNPTEFSVLELLYHQGSQPIQLIGKKALIANSITYVIDKLEAKNYVVRNACSADRRVTFVELTEEGQDLMKKIFPDHEKAINEVFQDIEPSEVATLIESVKKIGYQAKKI
ncbi:MarR family transcriptional regulator [Planococcus sp. S3-L1]|uniref:MarR family winged helix-turn-helix transcriptional regulator n=1 Tax=Planococcus sp. S3-L1 TaxID=3046200 RepID=UPI0024B8E552|nr:MarR family transcriptional regulator [Planococcus sp. S3-L1]MDJ0332035.1 MarR family transcriptional regulator [Planococcus sp. S3-L1]